MDRGSKEALRAGLQQAGVPASDASRLIDLGAHAALEGELAVERVLELLPPGDRSLVRSVAAACLTEKMRGK